MTGLYIGDQLLQELFTFRGALARDPLLLPIRLNRTKTFGTNRLLIGDCPKVRREATDVRLRGCVLPRDHGESTCERRGGDKEEESGLHESRLLRVIKERRELYRKRPVEACSWGMVERLE
jgi:hypothetical protein